MSQPGWFGFKTFEALIADFEGARPGAEQRFLLEHLPGGAPVIEAGGSAIGFFGKITGMLSIKPSQSSGEQNKDCKPFGALAELFEREESHQSHGKHDQPSSLRAGPKQTGKTHVGDGANQHASKDEGEAAARS